MFRFQLLFVASSLALVSVIGANKFPSDIEQCAFNDSKCLSKVITQILRTHSNGHRGLNIIPFDPLHIKSLVLPKIANSPVNVEFNFHDVELSGISQGTVFKVAGFTKDPSDIVVEMHANLPEIVLSGPYKIDGRVLILPIVGEGNSKIVFVNVGVLAKAKCNIIEKDGKKYLNIIKIHLDLQPKKTIFHLENLFNGNRELSDNMNNFMNENWEVIFTELKPVITEAIGKILVHIANGTFSKHAYEDLFLPS